MMMGMEPLHEKVFYGALGFLSGVCVASIGNLWWVVILGIIIGGYGYQYKKSTYVLLACFLVIGGLYYNIDDAQKRSTRILFDQPTQFEGIVRKATVDEYGQKIIINDIQLILQPYPAYIYGDKLAVQGVIRRPEITYANYLLKNNIVGIMRYPKVAVIGRGAGNVLMGHLQRIKQRVQETFNRFLRTNDAALMTGLTLGDGSQFTKEFKDQLARSGTTHLVALSGYNIVIIAEGVMMLLVGLCRRRFIGITAMLCIILFVIMTGGEASVVRAALMGGALIFANEQQRIYHVRNIITLVAAVMVLQNPKILVFDVGFQLSFLALIGIIYVRGTVTHLLCIDDTKKSILNWRENLTTTIAAQTVVLPMLLVQFGSFSWSGILANMIILPFVPTTMFLGFMMALGGFISHALAWTVAPIAHALLGYEQLVITFFSKFGYTSGVGQINVIYIALYYAILASIVLKNNFLHEKNK